MSTKNTKFVAKSRVVKKPKLLAKSKDVANTNWDVWPKWDGAHQFKTQQFRFSCSVTDYTDKSDNNHIAILKDRNFIEIYRKLTTEQKIENVFEVGFFQGGMPLFLADMIAPKKIVAIDWNAASDKLSSVIAKSKLETKIDLIGGIDQGDTETIRAIVEKKFGKTPLDLIVDDCSHYYPQSKACFENLFGYLKPGGKYIIEDWGWTHWPGEPWQSEKSHFHNMPSMTNLIFEVVMALGSNQQLVSHIEIPSHACVIVTRGKDLPYGAKLDLGKLINVAGGREAKLISPAPRTPVHVGIEQKTSLQKIRSKLFG
jgi:SAM-dependent methyltransferase